MNSDGVTAAAEAAERAWEQWGTWPDVARAALAATATQGDVLTETQIVEFINARPGTVVDAVIALLARQRAVDTAKFAGAVRRQRTVNPMDPQFRYTESRWVTPWTEGGA